VSSQLVNLKVKLAWTDFQGKAPLKTPFKAETASGFTPTFGGKPKVPNFEGSAGDFTLKDDVTITINFDKLKSWKLLDGLSEKHQKFLLDHEQGHYSISALVARDCFIDVMQLKGNSYKTELEGKNDVISVINAYSTQLTKIQAAYESETNHGAWFQPTMGPPSKSSDQTKWEGFFTKAFTTERNPKVTAPDGATYKSRLIDVLTANGIKI
jgi:hypothetical protein